MLDHRGFEGDREDRGADGLDLKEDDRAVSLVAITRGHKHMLPNSDSGVRIGDRGVVGLNVDGRGCGVQIDRYGVAVQFSREMQVAENFGGKLP